MWHCNRFCLSTSVLPFQYYSAVSLYLSSSNVARTRRTMGHEIESFKKQCCHGYRGENEQKCIIFQWAWDMYDGELISPQPDLFSMSQDGIDSVVGKRGLFMCPIATIFFLQRLKGSMSGDARDFNNNETRAIINLFFPPAWQGAEGNSRHRQKYQGNMHHCMLSSKSGWPSLNMVIFPPVKRFVLDDPKQ